MAIVSDALGQALSRFLIDDRTTAIENEVPVIVHLEGQNLQKIISSLAPENRAAFTDVVIDATKHLIESYSGLITYCHASEVSLLMRFRDSQRKSMGSHGDLSVSVASTLSAAVVHFAHQRFPAMFRDPNNKLVLPQFIARSFAFPSEEVAAKFFLWREAIARKSTVEALALKHFSANDLGGKSSVDRKAMLAGKGVDFEALPEHVRRGSFVRRYKIERQLDPEVLEKIPAEYRPKKPVMTMTIDRVPNMPALAVMDNLTEFVFNNATPKIADRPFAAAITV
jgi:tRNA(His) 5'-end guanylyltransferase